MSRLRSIALRHRWPAAAAAALAVPLAAAGLAGAGAALQPKVLATTGPIAGIAMDGRLVAYDVRATGTGCNRLRVRDVKTGTTRLVSGKGTCLADSTSTGAGVRELAIGGRRFAWIVNLGGNTESTDRVYTATWDVPKEKLVASATRVGEAGSADGRFLRDLVGDGSIVAYHDVTIEDGLQKTAQVRRAVAGSPVLIDGAFVQAPSSTDAGRIVQLVPGDGLAVWRAGTVGATIQLPGPARETAIQGDDLAVLLASGAVQVRSASTGQPSSTIPASKQAAHLDVHDGIVVWAVWRTVYAARVDGSQATALFTAPRRIVGVELEAPGLTYAWSGPTVGKLAFVPSGALAGAVT